MTPISAGEFGTYFQQVHPGREPFAWQQRLLDFVVDQKRWPDAIDAPTGSGKTAVVDVHIFCVAMMASGAPIRVPRRLSLVVDRRAIVDSHEQYASAINQALLAATNETSLLVRMRESLCSLSTSQAPVETRAGQPVHVTLMRGGVGAANGWLDDPVGCTVICATPDMWGSRLLLRGYGVSRYARPRAAGLLAFDSVVVIDEAHLNRQLAVSARSVGELCDSVAQTIGVPTVQVVAMTATQTLQGASAVGVSEGDIAAGDEPGARPADRALTDRLTKPKPVSLHVLASWPATKTTRGAVSRAIADEAVHLHQQFGGTVACVVNTVAMALAVSAELRTRPWPPQATDTAAQHRQPKVIALVGRLRPFELAGIRNEHPDLFTVTGDPSVDFVVATQTVEVGVDMDFSAMVTELASGSAIAQRVGRVNRLGLRDLTEVVVVGPKDDSQLEKEKVPYSGEELGEALAWVQRRSDTGDGLAPWSLRADPPPRARARRDAFQRVEVWDSWDLSRTSSDGIGAFDLDIWISDDFDADLDVSFVIRAGGDPAALGVLELLRVTPPRSEEQFPAGIKSAREYLRTTPGERLYVFREDALIVLERTAQLESVRGSFALRPGDVVVVGEDAVAFQDGVFAPDDNPGTSRDVFEALPESPLATPGGAGPELLGRTVRIGQGLPIAEGAGEDVGDLLVHVAGDAQGEGAVQPYDALVQFAKQLDSSAKQLSPAAASARQLLLLMIATLDAGDIALTVGPLDEKQVPVWMIAADTSRQFTNEEVRQTWSSKRVSLDAHSTDVQERATAIAVLVGLSAEVTEAMGYAGLLHDAGKKDPLFQQAIGNVAAPGAATPLAKSGMRSVRRIREAWAQAGLGRWRHEQYSAAICYSDTRVPKDLVELSTRLVGTSHGRGRGEFSDLTSQLLHERKAIAPEEMSAAVTLFDDARWESLVEHTDMAYGVWACAYLEALLRAADCQVSGEGR